MDELCSYAFLISTCFFKISWPGENAEHEHTQIKIFCNSLLYLLFFTKVILRSMEMKILCNLVHLFCYCFHEVQHLNLAKRENCLFCTFCELDFFFLDKLYSFDPRLPSARAFNQEKVNEFLQAMNEISTYHMWSETLRMGYEDFVLTSDEATLIRECVMLFQKDLLEYVNSLVGDSGQDAVQIPLTSNQSESSVWHQHRRCRITASTAQRVYVFFWKENEQFSKNKMGQIHHPETRTRRAHGRQDMLNYKNKPRLVNNIYTRNCNSLP